MRLLPFRIVLAAAFLVGCNGASGASAPDAGPPASTSATPPGPSVGVELDDINPRLLRRFQPLPESFADPATPRTDEQITLGRLLFDDPRLSADGTVTCASCHRLGNYGADNLATSPGLRAQRGTRNTPTVMNAAGSFAEMWDGRAASVEDQARLPILNPREMGMADVSHVESALRGIPAYEAAFRRAFPGEAEPRTLDNAARAIGAFERGLATPGRWDRFLRGDRAALTGAEKEGLRTFLNVGCMVCHTGPVLGGSMFERVGVVEPWPNQSDQGRYEVTHQAVDRMVFKVPTLRNVEKTAPYFHDASAATLEEAVHEMGAHQLGLELEGQEVAAIVTWLRSLTGELPSSYIEPPLSVDTSQDVTGCGASPLADCPLQGWMKANARDALRAGDFARLTRSFTRMASLGRPEYPEWSVFANAGAEAAGSADLEAVRKACGDCHRAYRPAYRRDHRTMALP
jgi:cytochrome c peroxidase